MTDYTIQMLLRIHQKLTFGNLIRCSSLRLWVGYFIYFKFTSFLVDTFSSIKETNKLSKEIDC